MIRATLSTAVLSLVELLAVVLLGGLLAGCGGKSTGATNDPAASTKAFAAIGEVLTHARCLNCHPSTDSPTQGDGMTPHQPPVYRGEGGLGAVGMRCNTCHGEANVALTERAGAVPGAPGWHLAPASMAWQGKSLTAICEQLKDPARNGGKNLEQLYEHMANDALVAWGWSPGEGREPVPGSQEEFAEQVRTWIDTGAHCPSGS